MNILFIEKITTLSLLRLIPIGRSFGLILYFDTITKRSQSMLNILRKSGLISGEIRQINSHIGHIRNSSGSNEYGNIIGRAWKVCLWIREEKLKKDPLINEMGSVWAKEKILLYFDKIIEREIQLEFLRINLVDWIVKNETGLYVTSAVLMVGKRRWLTYLEEEARAHNIRLMTFWNFGFMRLIPKIIGKVFAVIKKAIFRLGNLSWMPRCRPFKQPTAREKQKDPTLAIHYWHRNLSFEPTERSEFFWFSGVNLPTENVLLYDYVSDKPIDYETESELERRGIGILGQGSGIRSWTPSFHILIVAVRIFWKLLCSVWRCFIKGRNVTHYILRHLILLAMDYVYSYDFFRVNRVMVNIGTMNTRVAQVLAMDSLGGVTLAYQHASFNYFFLTRHFTSGENIQFVFSSAFENHYHATEAPVEYIVKTGYSYDGAIRELIDLNRVVEMRKKLQASGAVCIICFFDENTLNRWDVAGSDDDAVRDYEYLLKWLLSDPTLGIVFKPKNSINLLKRIARLSGLIEQAQETGRCSFLMSDMLYGNIFPAEAALIADICIGKLMGSTAALEARLANKPTILIDTEGFRNHPFHEWGQGRVVFNDWKSARSAIEQYRESPSENTMFGNWFPEIKEIDPFRDGKAGQRMGNYIVWIYSALKRGVPRQQAMAEAAERYGRQWGHTHVSRMI